VADVAIIIPYYQVTAGLLRRAVQSVLHACEPGRFWIVVVDDASPNHPLPEIVDLLNNGRCEITVLSRENGGAAAARNTGIDHVSGHVDYICFLDSDDEFEADHLRRMMIAFSHGADFYFCDTRRIEEEATLFEVCDFPRGPTEILSPEEGVFWFRGSLLQLTLTKNPYGTNSLGYRLAGQESVRFRTEFRRACEDRFFAMELSRKIGSVAFSTSCDVKLGVGVNIFAGSVWGTQSGLERMFDTTQFHVRLGREFKLSGAERRRNEQCLQNCDRDFWESALVLVVKSRRVPVSLVKDYLALRPRALMSIPHSLLRLAWLAYSRFRMLKPTHT
jgi:succinoglycan biosynthesis protein ExoW